MELLRYAFKTETRLDKSGKSEMDITVACGLQKNLSTRHNRIHTWNRLLVGKSISARNVVNELDFALPDNSTHLFSQPWRRSSEVHAHPSSTSITAIPYQRSAEAHISSERGESKC